MVNWSAVVDAATHRSVPEGAKVIAAEAARTVRGISQGIRAGARSAAEESKRRVRETTRKRQIVRRMYPAVVAKLALDRGLRPESSAGSVTVEDYEDALVANVSLNDLIDFASRRRIYIRDILEEINNEVSDREELSLVESTADEMYREVFRSIREFEPIKKYRNEYMYQAELFQWLRSRFPDTGIEVQKGSSRPDVVVGRVAVEIKGPTTENELRTIADKCMRYCEHFKAGIIVVLFDVRVGTRFYSEWANGIKKIHEHMTHIEVIRKEGSIASNNQASFLKKQSDLARQPETLPGSNHG
jgi:hypothetical protein